jgi:hypothetical protein
MKRNLALIACLYLLTIGSGPLIAADSISVEEDDEQIRIETPLLSAAVRKRGYVSGVAAGTLVDKRTGFHDVGFGLDIVDWIMEPGSDKAYRDQLDKELVYHFNDLVHGKIAKRSIEGPQICTRAREVSPRIIRGPDFVAVQMSFTYRTAAPGRKTGSKWTQTLVFLDNERFFLSSDRIDAVNSSDAMFLRIDLPGHIRHRRGDTFSRIYLSYYDRTNQPGEYPDGIIPAEAFLEDFPPDARFFYSRDPAARPPQRFIRAYRPRHTADGPEGPWLAGMTLDPSVVHEAWCHQRGYVCMIQEFGGTPVQAGESFSAAFVVGFFDTIEDMHRVYDRYRDHRGLQVDAQGWRLIR